MSHIESQHLTLGFSPCPNDTFIFDALVHGKVDTEGLTFDYQFHDVEVLNRMAFESELDFTKLSYHAFAHLTSSYILLDAGSALGRGCGPLFISREKELGSDLSYISVAIPGKLTTANFLFSLAFPNIDKKVEMLFSDIEDAILKGEVKAGVIIHENRFTYEKRGLHKILDLGQYWEGTTNLPIPLGGMVVKRGLPQDTMEKINRIMKRSVEYALNDPKSSLEFVRAHSQELDEQVLKSHIEMYVNDFTVDLGAEGRLAIKTLFEKAQKLNIIPKFEEVLTVNDLS
ncbi:MAG TPA: 1,4-dihydroxy-6-naphthoate synthase [Flavobacteriales bacterium]|nr:1,4-dihydroxy-6-naphthoate synthase [Flavobacteriales bacterium]